MVANKANETVQIFNVEIPRYKDCPRCGEKLACKWGIFCYDEPCNKCKSSQEWQEEQSKHKKVVDSIGNVYKNKQATAMWTYKGKDIFTNHKGDIIKEEDSRPRERGVVEKRKEYL